MTIHFEVICYNCLVSSFRRHQAKFLAVPYRLTVHSLSRDWQRWRSLWCDPTKLLSHIIFELWSSWSCSHFSARYYRNSNNILSSVFVRLHISFGWNIQIICTNLAKYTQTSSVRVWTRGVAGITNRPEEGRFIMKQVGRTGELTTLNLTSHFKQTPFRMTIPSTNDVDPWIFIVVMWYTKYLHDLFHK